MNESSLGRIYDLITREDCVFGIVSAFRKDLGKDQDKLNEERHKELKNEVRKMGYGFVELRGAWKEEGSEGEDIFEKSIIIGKISRDEVIALGKKYDQDAVIWHGDGKFELIDRDGNVENFAKDSINIKEESIQSLKELAEKDPERFKKLFIVGSWLKKGSASQRGKNFSFVFEAKMSPSVNRGLLEQKFGDERTWIDRFEFNINFDGGNKMKKSEEIFEKAEVKATVEKNGNHVSITIQEGDAEKLQEGLKEELKDQIADMKMWTDFNGNKCIEMIVEDNAIFEATDEEKQASEMLKEIAAKMIQDGVDKKKTDALENAAKVMAESKADVVEEVKNYFKENLKIESEVEVEQDGTGIAVSFDGTPIEDKELNKIAKDIEQATHNSKPLEIYSDVSGNRNLIYIDGFDPKAD